jgi:hypothetical protein
MLNLTYVTRIIYNIHEYLLTGCTMTRLGTNGSIDSPLNIEL